jgi:hypothetical protein
MLPAFYFPLAALPPQAPALPELPAGPSLDRVRGPIPIPMFEPWQIGVILILGILALGLLAWAITHFRRAYKKRLAVSAPHAAALAELDAAGQLTTGDDERFAVLSSLALRRYFETAQSIPALGKTTLEFLRSLDAHPALDAADRTLLADFLERCDRVKFARASISTQDRQALSANAKQLIQQLHQRKQAAQT